jgi:drug/metabolite transporter (DMT)-like permease
MLLGAFSFAVMSALASKLGETCDWQLVALARSLLALAFASTLVVATGARFSIFRPKTLWMRSIAGSLSLLAGFYALTRLPISDVLTLTNMFPIWVAVLAWPVLRCAPSPGVWVAVAAGIAGVVLIQRPHIAEGNFASLVALFASFTSALAMIGLHRLHGLDSRVIVAHFSGVSAMFCVVAWFVFPHAAGKSNEVHWHTGVMLVGMGATATLGQIMLTKAFASGPPDKVSVVGLSQVAFGMLLDVVIWQRTFTLLTLAGIALVMAPTAWLLLGKRVPAATEEGENL